MSSKANIRHELLASLAQQAGSSGVVETCRAAIGKLIESPAGTSVASVLGGAVGGPLVWGMILVGGCLLQCRQRQLDDQARKRELQALSDKLAVIGDRLDKEQADDDLMQELLQQNEGLRDQLAAAAAKVDVAGLAKRIARELNADTTEFRRGVEIYLSNISDQLVRQDGKLDAMSLTLDQLARRLTESDETVKARFKAEAKAEVLAELAASGMLRSNADAERLAGAVVEAASTPGFAARAEAEGTPLAVLDALEASAEKNVDGAVAGFLEAAQWAMVIGSLDRAAGSLDRALALRPDHTWALILRGRVATDSGSQTEAERYARRALEAARKAPNQRDESVAYNEIGNVEVAQGNLPAALKAYQDSKSIRERLSQADPRNTHWQRDLSISLEKIGNVEVAQGNLPAALKAYQDSKSIRERLSQADPRNTQWQRDLSVSLNKIGDVEVAQGNLPAALKAYEDDKSIAERLSQADPRNTGWQRDLSVSLNKIGDVEVAQGNLTAALKAYQDAKSIAERLSQADPRNTQWQRDLSVSLNRIGDVEVAQSNLPAALKAYQEDKSIAERLALADPRNTQWQRDVAMSCGKLGLFEGTRGDAAAARGHFEAGRAIMLRLTAMDPSNAVWKRDLAVFDAALASLGPSPP